MRAVKPKFECLLAALVALTLATGVALSATAGLNVSVTMQQDPTGAVMEAAMPDLGVAQLRSLPSGEVVVQLGELPQGGEPGDPMLPYALVRVLVPPDADLSTVKAKLSSGVWEELPGEYEIAPAPPAAHTDADNPVISWGAKDKSIIINGRDSIIYGTDAYFPTEEVQVVSVGQFRQWKLVEFRVWMAAYNPVKKKIRILSNASATLSVEKLSADLAVGLSSSAPPVLAGAAKLASQLLPGVDNPQDLETFYGGLEGAPSLVQADYVIITTDTIVTNSTKLASFILDKQAQGYTVKTVTAAAAADDTHYVSGASCDARADNIRSWLQGHWSSDGTEYVLLIGDPHPSTFSNQTSVPMKMCYPRSGAGSDESAPSDMYFAELSNTWNLDGDARYGEFNGDYGAGGCDKFCEVKVGRIPLHDTNYVNLDAILQKSIDYRNAGGDLSWRAKVLIPAAVSNWQPQDDSPYDGSDDYSWGDTFGDDWGEDVKSNASGAGFSTYTLYEKSGCYADGSAYPLTVCNATLNKANVKAEWPNKYGFVTWWGHGNQTGAYRRTWNSDNYGGGADFWTQHPFETSDTPFFQSADCAVLDDTCPSFVVQVSCHNGRPENSSNLGYSLLKQGAIGTISGTRVTWYAIGSWGTGLGASVGDNASYGYYMFDEMGVNNNDVGTAFVNCKSSFGTNWADGSSWMNMVEFSLYGDPSLSLSVQQMLKWQQPPDDTEQGIDLRCDRSDGINRILADDFPCTTTGPITKVTIWGSWFNDIKGTISKIHLSIHSDNPNGPSGWSEPNELLWEGDFYPADFDETLYATLYDGEWFWDPTANVPPPTSMADRNIWQYDISIDSSKAFIQQGDPCNPVTYWLDAYVELQPDVNNPSFGWKSTYEWEQWNDDAVWWDDGLMVWNELRYPPGHYYSGGSINLAFSIMTGEEVEPNDIKWSQPPVPHPYYEDTYVGWDEESHDWLPRMVLDDFLCDSNKPVTAIRWWGSFLGWNDNVIPAELPDAFLITIWDNVPAGVDAAYSHPNKIIWGTVCDVYDVDFYGWEYDPMNGSVDLAKFEFYQELDPCDYWYQPNDAGVYWLGITALYGDMSQDPCYPWGWETREHFFEDDAVRFFGWPEPNTSYPPEDFEPIEWQEETWDLSFELLSNPRIPPKPAVPHLKWSQPPIEIDPTANIPTYCGWDEESYREWIQAGAYFPCWDCPTQCYGDTDCDTDVDAEDLLCFTAANGSMYGDPDYDHCADFDRDFYVGSSDQDILFNWLGYIIPSDCPDEGDIPDPQSWRMVADDFRCLGTMPVTSIHWWGSYVEWDSNEPPLSEPIAWRIGFWSNIRDPDPGDPSTFSYPRDLLWQIEVPADRVDVDNVGQDYFPEVQFSDTCFQYHVDLTEEEYFWQSEFEPNTMDSIFWLSIAAVYPEDYVPDIYRWGWKTRPWSWMDDAVIFQLDSDPEPGMPGLNPENNYITPIEVEGESYDVAFELDTDPNYIKWEQDYTGIRNWPHYEDEMSMGTVERWTEEETKWLQEPDFTPNGIDVDATMELTPAPIWPPQILADDFNCVKTGPITNIAIWGSWLYDEMPVMDPMAVEFTLSIYSDNPSGPAGGWSEPNELLWSMDFPAGAFIVEPAYQGPEGYYNPCQYWYGPQNHNFAWKYIFHIDPAVAFVQEGDPCEPVVYWLAVQARPIPVDPESTFRFGWKTSIEHWNDDAVWAIGDTTGHDPWQELHYPEQHPFYPDSIDLAFEIVTENEYEQFVTEGLVADDWRCERRTPVTAIAWWGSYIGYGYEACSQGSFMPLPVKPDYFQLNIWTDVAAGEDPDPGVPYSHPGEVIWEYKAYDYDEVLVGYDKHPEGEPNEPVFRYSVELPEDDWFHQLDVNEVFWLSVEAVYDFNTPNYDWGWTNHEHVFNDNAVEGAYVWDPEEGWHWEPLYDQTDASEDMSFVLFASCGSCPVDQSSWNPGVPDGWMGPEDVAWLINIIKNYPGYYCQGGATPDCNPCLDFSSWNPGVPDGWLGPEDVAYIINIIKNCPGYYCQCP